MTQAKSAERNSLTDAQWCALSALADQGPVKGEEVSAPLGMDGKRKVKLVCHLMTAPTLKRLEDGGLVSVARGVPHRKTDAVGKRGQARRNVTITITEAGRAAITREVEVCR